MSASDAPPPPWPLAAGALMVTLAEPEALLSATDTAVMLTVGEAGTVPGGV